MSDLPLVSIVIPAYNAADYLREAIDSVLNQSYPNIEFIVLDDGSTDGTADVLKSYPEERFYRERHSNMGQSATMNKGWAMARGEILGYLSADDALLPNAVEHCVKIFNQRPDISMCYCDYEQMNENSETLRTVTLPDFDYRAMVLECVCVPGPGVLWRRSAFEMSGGWNPNLRQIPDFDFWLRLGIFGEFHHVDKVLARFRVHTGSQTCSAGDLSKSEEVVRVMMAYYGRSDLPATVISGKRRALASAHIFSAALHLKAGRVSFAFRHLGQAIRLMPYTLLKPITMRRLAGGILHHIRNRNVRAS